MLNPTFRRALLPAALAAALAGSPSAQADSVRFATFNASLNRDLGGQLLSDLAIPGSADFSTAVGKRIQQAHNVAEIIQRIKPDVLLINEFDFDHAGIPGASSTPMGLGYSSEAAKRFQDNFLSTAHGDSARGFTSGITYAYRYTPNTNTGIASGFDLNNAGGAVTTPGSDAYGQDAFGYGQFPGQYGMTIYSKYEIVSVRTFQNFFWKDMPNNLLTSDPTPGANNLANFYTAAEVNALRLSSKNHVDVVLKINGQDVHFIAAHPTPPVFDGAEDRNGKRNHDEIRFLKDYISGSGYIYDDQGRSGGLAPGAKFVLAGDFNADPNDGDSYNNAIRQLLDAPLVNTRFTPSSAGGAAAASDPSNNGPANASHLTPPMFDTADFNDIAPGNLRVDYVLPSANLEISGGGVFWPVSGDPTFPLVGTFRAPNLYANFASSDHKAVWVDVLVPVPEPETWAMLLAGLGLVGFMVSRRRV